YSFSNTTTSTMFSQFLLLSSNGEFETYEATGTGSGSATLTGDQPAIGTLTSVVDSSFMTSTNSWDIVDWGVPNGDYALDLAGQVLPAVTGPPAFDGSADQLTGPVGSGATPDFLDVAVTFVGDPAVHSWQIVAPYAA